MPCACKIVESGHRSEPQRIVYCPLHAHAEEMREMLREVEWGGQATAYERCPSCGIRGRISAYKHDTGCKLTALLAKVEG